ncbi:hypothetical protein [Ornithinibacillus halotolerans]|nr:hypothetical protein [Ornithinibacillus halotolerans]
MMNDIAEELVKLLEDLNRKERKLDEISNTLQGIDDEIGSGPGYLYEPIIELELIIVKMLGGTRKNLSAFRELDDRNPLYLLEEGNITRQEFLKQIKRGIESDLTPDAVLSDDFSYED